MCLNKDVLLFMSYKIFKVLLSINISSLTHSMAMNSEPLDYSREKKRQLREFDENKENGSPNSPERKKSAAKTPQRGTRDNFEKKEPDSPFLSQLEKYEQDARLQYAETLFKIACHHENGVLVRKDPQKALSYYAFSAKNGFIKAYHNIGCMLSNEENELLLNYNKAIVFYSKALEGGCVVSAYSLGCLYHEGKGVVQDYSKAAKYFKISADQGDADSLYMLATYHEEGKGVSVDLESSFSYYLKAAEQGHDPSMYRLALNYFYGRGAPKNDISSLDWMIQASRKGNKEAEAFLKKYVGQKSENVDVDQDFTSTRQVTENTENLFTDSK